ncbi:uncharacterized protein N7483_006393 [Penicillium malachiteum]|uniref:uncharacterized protein n=1 Tax=Penicillium malachiteum TaxID=1324776 RepID=UPI00254932FF|nr:uncharacterized protein N7483_006393 [Penicillium malachiteum]KAJ5725036.1 hypothetical protein N7483_006393 [Penicillium malachiteum]
MKRYKECVPIIANTTVAVHELIGHGSGKLLAETSPGESPPINPLTGYSVQSWYLSGQTWTSVFGELSDEIEECRAEMMSMYLMESKELSLYLWT